MSLFAAPSLVGSAFWERVLDAIRVQEGNPNYGAISSGCDPTDPVQCRLAASDILASLYHRLGSLPAAISAYGGCGPSSLPGQPCGPDYLAAVTRILNGGATIQVAPGGPATAPAEGPTPSVAVPGSAKSPISISSRSLRTVAIGAGVVLIALALFGITAKPKFKVVPA